MRRFVDLTGQTFGRLTVIRSAGQSARGHFLFCCACSCGAEITVRGSQLKDGSAASCGCIRKKYEAKIGDRFGRLTVTAISGYRVVCICDCGVSKTYVFSRLHLGTTKSCGCYRVDNGKKSGPDHGSFKHGHASNGETPTYCSWRAMINRCLNPNDPRYSDYGGRGITVYERWKSFPAFLADMGERPEGKTLDRIKNDLGYFPDNCKWSTPTEQMRNRRNSSHVALA